LRLRFGPLAESVQHRRAIASDDELEFDRRTPADGGHCGRAAG
jgi:hypothetical protein